MMGPFGPQIWVSRVIFVKIELVRAQFRCAQLEIWNILKMTKGFHNYECKEFGIRKAFLLISRELGKSNHLAKKSIHGVLCLHAHDILTKSTHVDTKSTHFYKNWLCSPVCQKSILGFWIDAWTRGSHKLDLVPKWAAHGDLGHFLCFFLSVMIAS